MKIRTAKSPHRAQWVNAPIHSVHKISAESVVLTLENHQTGGFTQIAITIEDAESPYFDALIEQLVALRTKVRR